MPVSLVTMNIYRFIVSLICIGRCLPAAAFDLQGHRGTRGHAPENTLPAFERALQIGVSTLELDIGVTADGVVVISHDPFLNPPITRDADGKCWPAPQDR
jgi:glycerophosphoryl diester phosphodiesterase